MILVGGLKLYVCVYVCMYVCMHAHMQANIRACLVEFIFFLFYTIFAGIHLAKKQKAMARKTNVVDENIPGEDTHGPRGRGPRAMKLYLSWHGIASIAEQMKKRDGIHHRRLQRLGILDDPLFRGGQQLLVSLAARYLPHEAGCAHGCPC
jgi:hypothetical protein